MQSYIGRVGVCWWYEEMAVDMELHLGNVDLVEDEAEWHWFVVGERVKYIIIINSNSVRLYYNSIVRVDFNCIMQSIHP